jgi:hypothetical protein
MDQLDYRLLRMDEHCGDQGYLEWLAWLEIHEKYVVDFDLDVGWLGSLQGRPQQAILAYFHELLW